jgi:chondroitin 4-sulfotransferase 11
MISHEHKCIFVHIPKTAGNSINRVFGVGWENHKDLQRYHTEVTREAFDRYFKFAIVRNPWDRILSDYNYQKKKSREKASKLFMFSERGRERDFAEWVEAALAAPDFYAPERWGGEVSPHIHRWSPQVDWIEVSGTPRVDFVARLENLPQDFRLVCDRLGLPDARLPHRNRRLHWHYSHYYDRTTRDIVATYYARDIAHFGYEFEKSRLSLALRWPFAGGGRRTLAERAPTPAATPSRPEETNDTSARPPRACTVSFYHPAPRRAPPVWRRTSTLAATAALIFGAFTLLALNDDSGAPPRELVDRVVRRSYAASTAPGAPAPAPNDPFFNLVQRATRLKVYFVPLANGTYAPVPFEAVPTPPQMPVAYGLMPGPIPPGDNADRPWFRWRTPRS